MLNIFDLSSLVATFASILGALASVAFTLMFAKSRKGSSGSGFEPETEAVLRRISPEEVDAGITEKQYLLMREYHAQGLAQSKISFWFSLVFASIGFAVIVSAAFTLQPGVKITEQGQTLTTLVAGTVIDAVSALFFVQSNKARQLMVAFFDRLRSDRKLDEALRLAQAVDDPTLKNRLQTVLAVHFADVKPTDNFLTELIQLNGSQTQAEQKNG